ncbi:LpxI family protein [Roseovarius salinarum]|uniref:LpxI family protein n=1 Tax=Roseovarius salinarum TaxID=1981892 RepID=UPI000C32059C|nr:UDP-2,3-diacylglucosamine diphosphatase LpxI [Roseovarius salinarum]
MGGDLAILACGGRLPVRLAEAYPDALIVGLAGVPNDLGGRAEEHGLEELGSLFARLAQAKVSRLVFAGHLTRPPLDPGRFDATMTALAPRLMAAMGQGDDALLSEVIAVFEEQGVAVVGAHELLPDLTAAPGLLAGSAPGKAETRDAARAADILMALSPLDIGQGAVVAGGQCFGIETIQGTDALLDFVARTPDTLRRGYEGVYVKAAKRGQDLRIDMPAIGPRTVAAVADAGLAGMVIEAHRVMILDRAETLQAVCDRGLFLAAQEL